MKATGIVRKVDDLGRIILPKEIRKGMHIREGEPMEIYVDDGKIILEKHRPLEHLVDISFTIRAFENTLQCPLMICDLEKVIPPREDRITEELAGLINERKPVAYKDGDEKIHVMTKVKNHLLVMHPIITGDGDLYGAVVLMALPSTKQEADESMILGAKMIAGVITEHLNV